MPSDKPDLAGAKMIETAQESVVQVKNDDRSVGAGVVLGESSGDEENLVLTNAHVVAGRRARGALRVVLRDGRAFGAEVARRSRELDLALLRLDGDPGGLGAASFGDSDALRVGQLVFAIGHPWGRTGAVAAGVVSSIGDDPGRGWGPAARYVRSDVALAPGNSGGPLLDARGSVVGINAMVSGSTALSVASNAALAWAKGHRTRRARLGVGVVAAGLPDGGRGLVVAAVEPGGPADASGLLVGDVLVGTEAGPLPDAGALLDAVNGADGAVRLRVLRGGRPLSLDVPFGAPGRAA